MRILHGLLRCQLNPQEWPRPHKSHQICEVPQTGLEVGYAYTAQDTGFQALAA